MAKKPNEDQLDLFPEDIVVGGLAITEFKISGSEVVAKVLGVTNAHDVAKINKETWQQAIAHWLVALHNGDIDMAMIDVKKAYVQWINEHGEPHRETPSADIYQIPRN